MTSTRPIKRALISLFDKDGIVPFARFLHHRGIAIISTGGTARLLRKNNIDVQDVANVTGFPEILDGRVKTLHPHIHAGLLARRDLKTHMTTLGDHRILEIDLVVINLYPFIESLESKTDETNLIEMIDIGGPSMIRSAAKNHASLTVIVDPKDYAPIMKEMEKNGTPSLAKRRQLAAKAFATVAHYDHCIASWMEKQTTTSPPNDGLPDKEKQTTTSPPNDGLPDKEKQTTTSSPNDGLPDKEKQTTTSPPNDGLPDKEKQTTTSPPNDGLPDKEKQTTTSPPNDGLPDNLNIELHLHAQLRYGENPHQKGSVYRFDNSAKTSLATTQLAQGNDISWNNLNDGQCALSMVQEFKAPSCVIVKHASPCGVASDNRLATAWDKAFAADQQSAYGGIVACNKPLDAQTAKKITRVFLELLIVPDASDEALEILSKKPRLRVMICPQASQKPLKLLSLDNLDIRSIDGGLLVQERDHQPSRSVMQVVSELQPSEHQWQDLLFANTVCKYVRSNAIVYAVDRATLAIGGGQTSRVSAAIIAGQRLAQNTPCVVASDAFFPFADGLLEAIKYGAKAAIQPGGSKRDDEVIAAANARNISMVFTGLRHFRH